MVFKQQNGIRKLDTILSTTTICLLEVALHCQILLDRKIKSPVFTGLRVVILLFIARRCQMLNHSHSIVAGGLPEMS